MNRRQQQQQQQRDRAVPGVGVLAAIGFALVVIEWILILFWASSGIYFVVRHVRDSSEELLAEHRTFAFGNFLGAIALMLAAERYRAFEIVRAGAASGRPPREWSFAGDIGYLGSWAAAFVITMFTDVFGVVILHGMPTGVRVTAAWRLEMAVAAFGMLCTFLNVVWSIAVCAVVYGGSRPSMGKTL